MVRFFQTIVFTLLLPLFASAETYLLKEPIQQTVAMNTPIRKTIFVGTVLADLAWTAGNTFVYYQITNEPISTAAYGAYNLASGIAFINAEVRMQEEVIARLGRRKEIRKVAEAPGAKEVRVLTTGHFEQTSPYSTTLHSKSFLFLESDEPPKEGNWTRIDVEKNPKIRLDLKVPKSPGRFPSMEISLSELFEGTEIPEEQAKEWKKALQEFSKNRTLWQKWVTKKGFDGLEVTATLLADGKEIPMGPMATDGGVFRFLEGGKFRAWGNSIRSFVGIDPKPVALKTSNTRVIRSKGCGSWFQRLLGNEVIGKSIKE